MNQSALTRHDTEAGVGEFDSIAWAFNHIHLTDIPDVQYAMLYGNEDSPDRIEFFRKTNPTTLDVPYAVWTPNSGLQFSMTNATSGNEEGTTTTQYQRAPTPQEITVTLERAINFLQNGWQNEQCQSIVTDLRQVRDGLLRQSMTTAGGNH
jgi:hypothetical protein